MQLQMVVRTGNGRSNKELRMLSVVAFLFLGLFCADAGNVQEISK